MGSIEDGISRLWRPCQSILHADEPRTLCNPPDPNPRLARPPFKDGHFRGKDYYAEESDMAKAARDGCRIYVDLWKDWSNTKKEDPWGCKIERLASESLAFSGVVLKGTLEKGDELHLEVRINRKTPACYIGGQISLRKTRNMIFFSRFVYYLRRT